MRKKAQIWVLGPLVGMLYVWVGTEEMCWFTHTGENEKGGGEREGGELI